MAKEIKLIQEEGQEEVPMEVIASAIVKLSDSAHKLLNSGLNKRALIVLLHDSMGGGSKVGRPAIAAVLEQLPKLKEIYVQKRPRR